MTRSCSAAVPSLSADIKGIGIDAKLGRQVSAALDLLNERKASGQLKGAIIIIHLGSNGTSARPSSML